MEQRSYLDGQRRIRFCEEIQNAARKNAEMLNMQLPAQLFAVACTLNCARGSSNCPLQQSGWSLQVEPLDETLKPRLGLLAQQVAVYYRSAVHVLVLDRILG